MVSYEELATTVLQASLRESARAVLADHHGDLLSLKELAYRAGVPDACSNAFTNALYGLIEHGCEDGSAVDVQVHVLPYGMEIRYGWIAAITDEDVIQEEEDGAV